MLQRIALGLALILALIAGSTILALAMTGPEGPPAGSESATRLERGPHPVGERAYAFVDETRTTAANGSEPSLPSRTLESILWYPEDHTGNHPFIVYSHGFMSTKDEGRYIAEHLASHGYVVVAAAYPLTNFTTPGGPNVADAVNQPADVSFLIDSVLALAGPHKPFAGEIDRERIGAMGLSLGGLTTTLATFHPRLRDPRIRAAVSIAGPGSFFGPRFFEASTAPFLMIAGSLDAMIDYETHARPLLDRARGFGLLTIEAGSHTGFASIADPLFRFVDHPDSVGCGALMENIEVTEGENPFADLGDEADGIIPDETAVLPCQGDLGKAVHPGRQHMITVLAASDFFESHFASDPRAREAAKQHLERALPEDFAEANYEAGRL